jgi:anaerobic magnesium-protoporphyrin IX monomethyl ester cyclase
MDLIWACRSRIDTVDRELLEEMKAAGCRRIYFGIESGVDSILKRIHKGITLSGAEEVIRLCRELGIQTLGFFLVGAPGETQATFRKTLDFAKRLDLDYVQFSKCLAKPLTPLWKEVVSATGQDYWKDWVLGRERDRVLPRPWTDLSNAQIDRLARNAYISFHSHPNRLWKAICRVKSWSEFKRKSLAFWDMLFSQEKFSVTDNAFLAFNENQKKMLISCRQRLRARARQEPLLGKKQNKNKVVG